MERHPFPVPPNLRDGARRYGHEPWLATLPDVLEEVERTWHLQVGEPFEPGGVGAWVAPARTQGDDDLVVKLGVRHPEGLDEAPGLVAWDGDGAIRLHADTVVGETQVLLLERCRPGLPLSDRPMPEQDAVIAGLLRRLWSAPTDGHPFRPLADLCDLWIAGFERRWAQRPVDLDVGLIREALARFSELARSGNSQVLLCTDLHAGNVLAARREPWLMIDPKPYVGDPAYDVIQHLLNGPDRLLADARGAAQRLAALLDLDEVRVTDWLLGRCVIESLDNEALRAVARGLGSD